MDFHDIRKEYETRGIDDSELNENPMTTFRLWLDRATESSPGEWFETNAMTLATAGSDGMVTSRVVLLKGIDSDAIRFYTNYESLKGQQLQQNPQASVNFHWPWLGRQIRMRGTVSRTSREDSESYFHSRPRGSQLGAAVSRQSQRIESKEELEAARMELESRYDDQPIPLPDFWGGYALTPQVIEFWQGQLDRMHDRVVYQQQDQSWVRFRISP